MLSPLLLKIYFDAIPLVALQRSGEGAGILVALVHLQEQPVKVGPETALECAWRAAWGMFYADNACIMSRLPHELELMETVFENWGTFGLNVSESKTGTVRMPIPRAPATPIGPNAAGQHYPQTTSFIYLRGALTEISNLSAAIDRQIRAGSDEFQPVQAGTYGRPKASLPASPEGTQGKSRESESFVHRCFTWTPLSKGSLQQAPHRTAQMSLRILGAWCRSPDNRVIQRRSSTNSM